MMTTVINSASMTSRGQSIEDIETESSNRDNWYYVKTTSPPSPKKTSITPQLPIKFKSAKKSPSMSSINMAPSTTLTFHNRNFPATNDNMKYDKIIPNQTKETKDNDYFTCPLNGSSSIYSRMGNQYTMGDPDNQVTSNFRQNQEYWKDIADRGINQNNQHKNYYDRTDNVVRFQSKQQNCQKQTPAIVHKQTHPVDVNSSEQQHPNYMQIENLQNFDKHKFPSYSSGLSHNDVGGLTSAASVYSSHAGRIQQQPSPAPSPLMAYRRTMKFIQKRSDETSCGSSFEQLNIIGIPTTSPSPTTSSLQKQVIVKNQSLSSPNNAINKSERQTNGNYDIQLGISSMERMKYSSEPKKRRPLPKLPIETMVSLYSIIC